MYCYLSVPDVIDMTTERKENQNHSLSILSGSSSFASDAGAELNDGTTKLSMRASMTPRVEMVARRASLAACGCQMSSVDME